MDHEARHDRLVPVPPPVEGVQRGAGGQTHSHLRPEPEAGHLAHRQVQGHRRGRHQPRQTDHYCNEKLKKHRDGTLHPVQAVPRSSTWTLKSSRSGPPSPSHTWLRRPANI
ncbi:ATP-dependent RNA helicase [Giardia duodenalis]|uniref:ATP-dependent RNA helicase n=1 Tax=Giardia intestinalis TaxID=5741 RepID=V6TNP6_GIAIN|nr:ATP-dependent RNA helicase [Giardia intestinalis]